MGGGEQVITQFVQPLDLSPIMFLIPAQIIIFLFIWPLESSGIINIYLLIFLPLLAICKIALLFFGTLVLYLQTRLLTPPMAMPAYKFMVSPIAVCR